MESDMWATLPCDLLVEIFRRLGSAALIRCAGVCRPWRRAIIGSSSCLRPRPDRFVPDLLLGFMHRVWNGHRYTGLRYVLAPFQSTPVTTDAAEAAVRFLAPAVAACGGVDVRLYYTPLSPPRDGFVLLGGSEVNDLCLCNPLTGSCKFLPAADLGLTASGYPSCVRYVLATSYDESPSGGSDGNGDGGFGELWLLAVDTSDDLRGGMAYRIFSFTSGEWGPIKRSPELKGDAAQQSKFITASEVVICGSAVYWVVLSIDHFCAFAMDMRAGRTWITEFPKKHGVRGRKLATSEDGRLSLILLTTQNQISVWVLTGESQWTLQLEVDEQNWLPSGCCPKVQVSLRAFCPRSGCMCVCVDGQDLVIAVDRRSKAQATATAMATTRLVDDGRIAGIFRYPYEMDWSTYISKMKYF